MAPRFEVLSNRLLIHLWIDSEWLLLLKFFDSVNFKPPLASLIKARTTPSPTAPARPAVPMLPEFLQRIRGIHRLHDFPCRHAHGEVSINGTDFLLRCGFDPAAHPQPASLDVAKNQQAVRDGHRLFPSRRR